MPSGSLHSCFPKDFGREPPAVFRPVFPAKKGAAALSVMVESCYRTVNIIFPATYRPMDKRARTAGP